MHALPRVLLPLAIALVPVLVVAGCGTGADASPPATARPAAETTAAPIAPSPSERPTTVPGSLASMSPSSPSAAPAGVTLTQPWATATLTDVRTGEPFRIADLVADGRTVFLETMAIWCTKCHAEQQEATVAFQQLDRSRVTWVAVDVESTESADALARYSEDNGFDFTYAIADQALARALATEFGDQVLNPPSVNVIVIGPDGEITASRGHRTADELVALATEHGA